MTDLEIRDWAARVVDQYASRVRMTLLEQGELERAIAVRFRAEEQDGKPIAHWADAANRAIDEWEKSHPQRGSRVSGFSVTGKQVIEKPRSF